MKKIILLISFLTFLSADTTNKKVVYDLTTPDIKVFERKVLSGIANIKSHYEGKLEELDVAVVIHGGAYKFFIDDLSSSPFKNDVELVQKADELKKRVSSLNEMYDVEFLMCDFGRKKNKIKADNLYKFVKLVPNSTIGLIDKQSEGYGYVPIFK